jgi:hypothetical protein
VEPHTHFDTLVDFLLTVGYIDGVFDEREQDFVRGYLDQLAAHVAPETSEGQRAHFDTVFARLELEIVALNSEVMAADDDGFITSRLKVRAVALFRTFSPTDQALALELVNGLVAADGTISAAERSLHEELVTHLVTPPPAPPAGPQPPQGELLQIDATASLELSALTHPLLDQVEQSYETDLDTRQARVGADYELIFDAITVWERQRARGNGRLAGIADIAQLPPGTRLLDGHVHVLRPDRETELVVLGDLHGCYSCFKAALLQSDFIERVRRFQADPLNHPDIKLVLLGDYLDRGRFGFEGVLRAALQLLVTLPNHVVLLRGNHEFLVRMDGRVVSAVSPAEAVPAIEDFVSQDVLEAYRHLFEHMPTSFLFDRTLFVHAGIPRDETLAERYRDLSSLDDAMLRFEMMWSDPIDTDHVPAALQRESTRFSFGRDQFRAFMERTGCHALIRGHEQIDEGFRESLSVAGRRLYTLFSAGGHNPDLPVASRYRSVTPMALTIHRAADAFRATPWPIQYEPFGNGDHNRLYR